MKRLEKKIQKYLSNPRYAFMSNGDRVKLGENQNIEEVFSPRYGFHHIPEELIKEVKGYPYFWNFYGNHVYLIENEEYEVGYQNNFFVMKPEDKWIFRTKDDYLSEADGFKEPYIELKPNQRVIYIQ